MDYTAFSSAIDDYGFAYVGTTRRVAILNDVVADVCSREPWPFLETGVTLTFNGSSATPTNLPTSLLSVISMVNSTSGQILMPLRQDEFEKVHSSDALDVGTPLAYYFDGSLALKVWQVPSATDTLNMKYLRFHPTLTSSSAEADILIPARHHQVVLDGIICKLHRMADAFDSSSSFKQEYEERLVLMRSEIWMRQYDRTDTIQVLDSDFYDYE